MEPGPGQKRKRSARAFSSIQAGGGEGSRQAAHSEEEVNERGSRNCSPFIAFKTPLCSFLEFHLLPSSAKLGLRKAREAPRRAGRGQEGRGAGVVGSEGAQGRRDFHSEPGVLPAPQPSPLPQRSSGRPGRRLVPGTGGVRGGPVGGGGQGSTPAAGAARLRLGARWGPMPRAAGPGRRGARAAAPRPPERGRAAVSAGARTGQRRQCGPGRGARGGAGLP